MTGLLSRFTVPTILTHLYFTLVKGANLLPLVESQQNKRWSCNCNDYYLLSLVSPILCPRSVISRAFKLEAGDYAAHPLIWRHKNNISQLFPLAIATYFKAWGFEAQALTCSVDQWVRVQDSWVGNYMKSQSGIFTWTLRNVFEYICKRLVSPFQHDVSLSHAVKSSFLSCCSGNFSAGNLADWIE